MPDTISLPLELFDPFSGEAVDTSDRDALIAAWGRLKDEEERRRIYKAQLTAALASHCCRRDQTRVAYVRGEAGTVKLEFPADSWDQTKLKEAWHAYPQYRDELLTIREVGVRLAEYKKLGHTSGPADQEQFWAMVKAANRGPLGLPRLGEVKEV